MKEGTASTSPKITVETCKPDAEKTEVGEHSTSSEEEPSSSVSPSSDEEDPFRGEPRGRQICRRLYSANVLPWPVGKFGVRKRQQEVLRGRRSASRGGVYLALQGANPKGSHSVHGMRPLLVDDPPHLWAGGTVPCTTGTPARAATPRQRYLDSLPHPRP